MKGRRGSMGFWMGGDKSSQKKVRSKCGKWWKTDTVPVVVIDEEKEDPHKTWYILV